ncbi:hypothetical protein MXD62_19245 [Frankia sp. Mgl5]|uniref:hypothetical protein n=1 Tax=Frankia sp. Mgl5 TaxID=2933793 RepID=UPI00200EDB9B|nr:hypothetical protein [Frankia sp. Mgl5]MCK9929287.1 hypothetical protein [Frankia sp. Mgl5]
MEMRSSPLAPAGGAGDSAATISTVAPLPVSASNSACIVWPKHSANRGLFRISRSAATFSSVTICAEDGIVTSSSTSLVKSGPSAVSRCSSLNCSAGMPRHCATWTMARSSEFDCGSAGESVNPAVIAPSVST